MSEKEKRNVVSTEKSDAMRFRDIIKKSDDIMKTAYPADKDENGADAILPEKKASINPFTEAKPPKGPLDADFAPDGTILREEDPLREKTEKERLREYEKNEKIAARQNRRRKKLLDRIKKLEPKLAEARRCKIAFDGTPKYDKYLKREAQLQLKINDLQQRAVSAEQFTPNSGFYIKAHFFKMWVIILIFLVVVIIALSTALISATYRDLTLLRSDSKTQQESVSKLNDEVSTLNDEKSSAAKEKATLEQKIEDLNDNITELETKVSDYEDENKKLQKDSDFLNEHIRIVNGNILKKTYHKYGCSKIDYSSFWAYNKEQVEGKLGYTACPNCIK